MNRLLSISFATLAGSILLGIPDFAHAQIQEPKILLHAQTPTTKNPCADSPSNVNCQTGGIQPPLTVNWPADGSPAHVYAMLTNVSIEQNGLRAAVFGIEYQNALVSAWDACGNLSTPSSNWPGSGEGIVVTFQTCQTDNSFGYRNALLGYFYIASYADDLFRITPRIVTPTPELAYANCSLETFPINPSDGTGAVGFGSTEGSIPCNMPPIAVEPGTWGGVKKLFVESD